MVSVSIVVPCFNAVGFISDALTSIRQQSFTDWECLIVDDCSTDGSAAVIAEIAAQDPRIKPYTLTVNSGASVARNIALDAAQGKWLTFLDADDVYEPSRLTRLVTLAEERSADMAFDDQAISNFPSITQKDRAFYWIDRDIISFDADKFFVFSAKFGRSLNPGYMKPLFKRSFMVQHRLRYDPQFRSGQDFLLYANAFAYKPRCFASAHAGYIYRRRKGSLSRSANHLRNHALLSDEIIARHRERLSRTAFEALQRRKSYYLGMADLHDLLLILKGHQSIATLKTFQIRPRLALAAAITVQRRISSLRSGR